MPKNISTQINLSAYERKTIRDIFLRTMNWLEKYVETVHGDSYPDWKNRKQIHENWIKRTDIINNPELVEETLSTKLLLFERVWEPDLPFFEELKEEYYKWINATGININNCPERLKHFLIGFDEVLEGRGEKIEKDAENWERKLDPNSPEYMEQLKKTFSAIQVPLQEEREEARSLEGRNWNQIDIESVFNGDANLGKESFNQIKRSVPRSNHEEGFHFFPQKNQKQSNLTGGLTDDTEMTDYSNESSSNQTSRQPTGEYKWVNGRSWTWFPANSKHSQKRFSKQDASVPQLGKSDNKNNSNLGTIALITGILAVASLGIWGVVSIVKKSKKVKNK